MQIKMGWCGSGGIQGYLCGLENEKMNLETPIPLNRKTGYNVPEHSSPLYIGILREREK